MICPFCSEKITTTDLTIGGIPVHACSKIPLHTPIMLVNIDSWNKISGEVIAKELK